MIGVHFSDDLVDEPHTIEVTFRFRKSAESERAAVTLLGLARGLVEPDSRLAAEIDASAAYLKILAHFDGGTSEGV